MKVRQSRGVNAKEYQEIQGTHLLVNITGVDAAGKTLLIPPFMEFTLEPGEHVTSSDLLEKVQQTIDNHRPYEYQAVQFKPGSKVVVDYPGGTEAFAITDEGFEVPDLTKVTKNPGFKLLNDVVLKPVASKADSKIEVAAQTPVAAEHSITFIKKGNKRLIPLAQKHIEDLEKDLHVGQVISSEELQTRAEEVFKKTPEYQEGYQLIRRLNTHVIENISTYREVFNVYDGDPFNYVVSSKRLPAEEQTESIAEQYYISKNGDDLFSPAFTSYAK
ncbi:hypothetical protein [Macrococcus carouselicus]|uniref:Uncharacterized protein n=1 Tax=Macrococcus carouselicus TaxID=69969 RepID=A0A9Q8CJB1_9STAP|nr:hypothetical protein [Macrococcus carouselicus]TDM02407.1 hypothetical protein ERX40_07580 [Macrococcus carouselicus]